MDKNGKIGTNKVIGQPKTGTMRVANATSSGFGIIYADEIIGHRRVDTFKDLELIPNWALYDQAGGADISTAKGQLWYVSDQSKMYQLTGIDASNANRTWTEFKGTDSSYSLPLMSTTQRGGAKLGNDTTQTTDANPVTTTINRTYAVQKNASEQLVVNVPWVDTDNNTTYKFEDGRDGSFTVTPSGGTAKKVNIGTPENANHANMANSAGSATNDAQGHSIHLTYATKTEMASGLNGLDSKISALTSALVYKGTVNATNPLPTQGVKVGDVYVVAAPGTYAEQKCENGDMIIAKVGGNTPKWTVVQTNIDGAVTTTDTLADNSIILGSGDKTLKTFAPLTTDGYLYWSGSEYAWKKPEEFSLEPATADALGGIKIGYTPDSNKKNYAVKTDDDGNAYVNVPWTDTNTTYTSGTGIIINGNTIGWAHTPYSKLRHAFDNDFAGYLIDVAKTDIEKGVHALSYLPGTATESVEIIKIYDSAENVADGLASITAVRSSASSLQDRIQTAEDNLHEQINNVGAALNNKVNVADTITTGEIDKLFTNN